MKDRQVVRLSRTDQILLPIARAQYGEVVARVQERDAKKPEEVFLVGLDDVELKQLYKQLQRDAPKELVAVREMLSRVLVRDALSRKAA